MSASAHSIHARARRANHIGAILPGIALTASRSPHRVWSGSTTDEARFVPVSKKQARIWYQKARAWDRQTKKRGKHGGGIGLAAMAVLHSFHFDFLNYASGRLDPSYEGIARRTGLGRTAVANALAKLKALGVINWVRLVTQELVFGVFTLRQKSLAYAVLPPSQWCGYTEPEDATRPWPEAVGAVPPLPPLLDQALVAAKDGAPMQRQVWLLDADPKDELARALASLGRTMMKGRSA
jgi:hypothetical protein